MIAIRFTAVMILFLFASAGCSTDASEEHGSEHRGEHSRGEHARGEHARGEHARGEHARGEHARDGAGHDGDGREHHGEEGEESGTELALTETYDRTRKGARLVLAYDAATKSFAGRVENTTERTLERVRVEVHLSNGKELGPTTPVDLAPGAKHDVKLTATSTGFERWTAHPEVGSGEHGGEHR